MKKDTKKTFKVTINNKARLIIVKWIFLALLVALVLRLAYLQFVQGDFLRSKASAQQTSIQTIKPERGTIYDVNRKAFSK